jgi:uncharacterized protein (DUF169 family)
MRFSNRQAMAGRRRRELIAAAMKQACAGSAVVMGCIVIYE